uniref:Uncharacterized protein n=1 Tax=Ditylenchus dipsaci TaxID=166011 RepID=A0A915ELM9_9BILA
MMSVLATISFMCFFCSSAFTPASSFTINEEDSPLIAAMLAEDQELYGARPYYRNMEQQQQQMSNNAAFLRALYSAQLCRSQSQFQLLLKQPLFHLT